MLKSQTASHREVQFLRIYDSKEVRDAKLVRIMEAESSARSRGLKREAESHSTEHQNIEKGKAFQFELESSEQIPSNNSAGLVPTVDETWQVKLQLEMVTNSEDKKPKQCKLTYHLRSYSFEKKPSRNPPFGRRH